MENKFTNIWRKTEGRVIMNIVLYTFSKIWFSKRFHLNSFIYVAYMGEICYGFYLGLPGQTKHEYFRKYLDERLSFNGRNNRPGDIYVVWSFICEIT